MQKLFLSTVFLLATISQAVASEGNLFGTWSGIEQVPGPSGAAVPVETTIELMRNGTYSSLSSMPNGYQLRLVGTYQLLPGRKINSSVDNWEPKIFQGQPIMKPPGSLVEYTFQNANTLVIHDMYVGSYTRYHRQ
jgi:hypothetical protein